MIRLGSKSGILSRPFSLRGAILAVLLASFVYCLPASAVPPPNQKLADGIALYNQGKYMESLSSFNQAKATESDNPLLHYYMANALLKLKLKDDAIREYKMVLLLEPGGGRLTPLCQTALRALGASDSPPAATKAPKIDSGKLKPAGTTSGGKADVNASAPTGSKPPPKSAALQSAKCVSILCGCAKCQRLNLTLTDLNSKFGDRIEFMRTTMNASDDKSKELRRKYSVSVCPTVLLFSERSEHATEFKDNIVLANLCRDVEQLAKSATRTRYTAIEDKSLASMRQMVIDEVESRISHDVERVDFQVKKVQQECDENVASVHPRDIDASTQRELIKNEAERKIKAIRDDFEKRKREWYAAAEQRIKGISSTGPGK